MERFTVTIELQVIEIVVMAKNKTEAKKKALEKLNKKKPVSLIDVGWRDKRKKISVD